MQQTASDPALTYAVVYFIVVFIVPDAPGTAAAFNQTVNNLLSVFFIGTSVLFSLAINRGWLSGQAGRLAPLLFQIYGAVGIEVGILTWNGDPDVYRFGLSWTTVWIVSFPLFVPSPPRHTFWASIAAASAMPLMYAITAARGTPLPDAATLAHMIVPNYLSVGIAVLGAHVVYGLGRDVAEARRMGSYHLKTKLGEGGMGEVWQAEHMLLARPAAIKLIRPDLTLNPAVLERFEREVQATAELRSPHTIAVYDYGVTPDGVFYYVMELLEGFDLEGLVRSQGPLPPARAVRILRQACDSLAEAHDRGIVHRDIKPANIFLCRYGRQLDFDKVLDFGLVKHSGAETSGELTLTKAGLFTGTPMYSPPELATGGGLVDPRTDIYSLACVGYRLLTGRPVFEASTALEMLMKHAGDPPDAPSRHAEYTIPRQLDELILACLAKDPAARIQTADELARILTEIAEEVPWSEQKAALWWEAHSPGIASGGSWTRGGEESLVITKQP